MTLSRRDRAAMTLALVLVRNRSIAECVYTLFLGDEAAQSVGNATLWTARVSDRLLRARLALALRVLLRADAGDFGPAAYVDSLGRSFAYGDVWPASLAITFKRLPVRPLWEAAKPHEVAR